MKAFIQKRFGRDKMTEDLKFICQKFCFEGIYVSALPYGDGHINDTYKVTYINDFEEKIHYILQRINHQIFKATHELMENIECVTSYLTDIVKDVELESSKVLTLIKTLEGHSYYHTETGQYYRAYVFIENSKGYTFTEDVALLYEAGKSFGEFQILLKDFPVEKLHETIKNFHHTPHRFQDFLKVYQANKLNLNHTCFEDIQFVVQRKEMLDKITSGLESGVIPYRVTHNDTKLNNVLMDIETRRGVCVIDLDTVMPGSALYDYGDAIRSCGSTVVEDEEDLSKLKLDFDRFEAFTKGFLEVLKDDLTKTEIELLPFAAILMTLECGIRFLTDYLEGDVYFKVHKPNHNLIRARNQFKFVEVMEVHLNDMENIVNRSCMS